MAVVIRRALGTYTLSPYGRVLKHQRDESRYRNQQPNRGERSFEQHDPRDDQDGDAECEAAGTDTVVNFREAGDLGLANRQPTGIFFCYSHSGHQRTAGVPPVVGSAPIRA